MLDDIENKLEVIGEIIIIQGKFSIYHKYNDNVEVLNGQQIYKSKEDVIAEGKDKINNINKDIMILEEKLEALKRDRNSIMVKYSELEQVFNM